MRHFVNLALIPFFLTLLVTGALRFLVPFSLTTTRVHVVFGALVLILVALHIATRPNYFAEAARSLTHKDHTITSPRMILSVLVLWAVFVVAAIWNLPPVPYLINLSYESRQRQAIFRPDDHSVYRPVDGGMDVKRGTESGASLLIKVDWGSLFPEGYDRSPKPMSDSRPQIAIWTESKTGTLIETLFLSETAAFSETFEWGGQTQRRADVLPIWRHRYTEKTGISPEGEEVSWASATPEHSFSVNKYLKTNSDTFHLYMEVNAPNDPNSFYHSDKPPDEDGYMKPGLGQPSVIYGARIEPTSEKQYRLLDLVAHGGASSDDQGQMNFDLTNVTTARQLIDKVLIRVKRVDPKSENNGTDDE